MSDLNARLLTAHTADDKSALVPLYTEAANSTNDPNARAFYLTHAYIFALETGHPDAHALRIQLVQMKRET